jgi:RNA polymerase sigma-70 factor (ECF subfamily)
MTKTKTRGLAVLRTWTRLNDQSAFPCPAASSIGLQIAAYGFAEFWICAPRTSSPGGHLANMRRRGSATVTVDQRTYAEAPDADLIAWSANGDRRAFDEVVCRHGAFALRVALRLIPNGSAAEDVVQDAMLSAWSQSGRFNPARARFTTWLYRIVVNRCIDYRRSLKHETLPEEFDAVDPSANVEEMMVANEQGTALAKALRALSVRQRAAMTLVYDEGMSGAEAARVLGLSSKAVERLLARARACLREQLQTELNLSKEA